MRIGIGLALTGAATIGAGGAPTPTPTAPGAAPFFDAFTGDGALSARPGWAVSTTTAQAGFAGVLSTLSGNLRSTNTAAGNVYGLHDSGGGMGESRAFAKLSETQQGFGAGGNAFVAHATMDAANGGTAIRSGAVTGAGGILYHLSTVNGTDTARNLGQYPLLGAVLEHRSVNDAGTLRAQVFVNGRRSQPGPGAANTTANGIAIAAALGRAPNGLYGFGGALSGQTRMAGTSKAGDAWITVVSTGGIRQTGKQLYLTGEYSGSRAPTASEMSVTAYNTADDSVISGFNAVALTGFTASGGAWSGTIANPEVASFWLDVKWSFTDTGNNPAVSTYPTATILKGDVIVVEGQSQVEFIASQTADTTTTAAAQAVHFFAAAGAVAATSRSLILASVATSNWSALANAVQPYTGRPTMVVAAAQGGSPYSTRNKPSVQYDATLEGIKAAGGGRPAIICLCGGTSGEVGSIYTNIISTADNLDADLGAPQLYGVMPEGNDAGSPGSSTYAANRRAMWQLTKDFPARFKLLGWRNELQHNMGGTTVDPLHYAHPATSTGYVNGMTLGDTEFARRIGVGVAFHLYSGPDYRGPRITTATAPVRTATTLRIYFDCGAFDGLAIANTAYASDFTGGFEFNSASGFGGTVLTPTGATFGTVTGGVGYVEWAFTSLPATVYARCAMGDDPFNRTNVAAISQNMQARASYLVGTKSGVVSAAVWPSYDVGGSGVDYLTIP